MKEMLFNYYHTSEKKENIKHLLDLAGRCYLMSKEFSEELIKIKLEITFDILKELPPITYIEFPHHLIKFFEKDGGCLYLNGCFLLIGADTIVISFFHKNNGIIRIHNTDTLNIKDITSFFSSINPMKEEVADISNKFGIKVNFIEQILYAIKCGIYIKSGQPDLRHLVIKKFNGKGKKALRKHKRDNPHDYPVTLVGFNFKKSRKYLVDGTWVTQHLRAQHFGKKLSQIKIITIEEHERKYL